jgi:hypothetical protein
MKRSLPSLILLVCAGLLAGGCVNTGAIVVTGLQVEVTGIERATDGTVLVSWRVVNPNVTAYLLAQVRSKLYLNGTLVGTTLNKEPMGVPPQGNAAKSSKLTPASPAVDGILAEAAGHGPVSYRVDSSLIIQIYDEQTEKGELSNSGSVTVVSK